MCGRFTVRVEATDLAGLFKVEAVVERPSPSFNASPGKKVPVVLRDEEGRLVLSAFRWGLVPFWAKDPEIGNRLINARSETAAQKPAFRAALKRRRCLMLADGFYEWKLQGGRKIPHHITLTDRPLFAFAGLWEAWKTPEGEILKTCCLLTLEANAFMRPIHHRMPAILDPGDEMAWLDPDLQDPAAVLALVKPYPDGLMAARPVSTLVNNPRNDDPRCVLPLEEKPE